ncbi:MAG: VCBS domain-containing protein [Alphaproteobacteria bacterium]|nr:VCBS domain-containing protein [Alphaproteobacteria bacterium]
MAILVGGNGDNTLTGGSGSDIILAGNGDDLINGGGGSDLILAGNGSDTIDGGSGDDIILGGNGNDIFIHKVTENIDLNNCTYDFYDGERGSDTIRLVVTAQQAADLQAALTAFSTWNKKTVFNFQDYVSYIDLRVVNIENIQIVIEGPVNQAPVAVNATLDINEGDAAISGQLVAVDPNVGDTLTFSTSSVVAGFVLNPNGSYTFDATHTSYNHLAAGATLVLTIPFTVSDGNGGVDATKALTITLVGTNDAPKALNVFTTLFFEGGGIVNGTLIPATSDADDGAVLTYSAVGVAAAGIVIHADGTYTFDSSNPAYDHLAQGQTMIVTTQYMVTDEHGATSTANIRVEIMGANDAPVVVSALIAPLIEGDGVFAFNLSFMASDIDDGAILTYTPMGPLPDGLIINPNGTASFDRSHPSYNYLAAGQTLELQVPIMAMDEYGASSTGDLTLRVVGTNDAPIITAVTDKIYDEGTAISFAVAASDIDTGNVLTYALGSSVPSWLSIDSFTGVITGTAPTVAADTPYAIDVIVTDGAGATAMDTFTLTVTDVPPPLSRLSDVFLSEGTAPDVVTNVIDAKTYSDARAISDLNNIMVQTVFENLTGTLNPGDVSFLQSILLGGDASNTYIELGFGYMPNDVETNLFFSMRYGTEIAFNFGSTSDGQVFSAIMTSAGIIGNPSSPGAQEVSGSSGIEVGPTELFINGLNYSFEYETLIRLDQLTPTGIALLQNNLGVIEHVFVAQP